MSIKKDTELKIRKLLSLLASPLEVANTFMTNKNWTDTDSFRNTVEAQRLRKEIIKELGFLEDKKTGKLKQIKLKL